MLLQLEEQYLLGVLSASDYTTLSSQGCFTNTGARLPSSEKNAINFRNLGVRGIYFLNSITVGINQSPVSIVHRVQISIPCEITTWYVKYNVTIFSKMMERSEWISKFIPCPKRYTFPLCIRVGNRLSDLKYYTDWERAILCSRLSYF